MKEGLVQNTFLWQPYKVYYIQINIAMLLIELKCLAQKSKYEGIN